MKVYKSALLEGLLNNSAEIASATKEIAFQLRRIVMDNDLKNKGVALDRIATIVSNGFGDSESVRKIMIVLQDFQWSWGEGRWGARSELARRPGSVPRPLPVPGKDSQEAVIMADRKLIEEMTRLATENDQIKKINSELNKALEKWLAR